MLLCLMLEPNNLKKGVIFKYRGNPVKVLEYSHSHKGRGSAVVTAKISDLITGSVQHLTCKAGDKFDEADLARREADFLYTDSTGAHFMEEETYEQIQIDKPRIEEKLKFLKEGQGVTVIYFEGRPIDIDLPPKVGLAVIETEPGVKGDTASGTAYKPAKLESGYVLTVPLFVKEGDVIRVNTETGEYVERVTKG